MTDPYSGKPVSLVLDTSAVVAYTRPDTAIHVGDVLLQVLDEGAVAVIPLACLVEAFPAVEDTAMLDVLVGLESTTVLSDEPAAWRSLAEMVEIVGRPDAASAALAAIDFKAQLLTRTPGWYAGVKRNMVIEIPH